jgi:leucyl aminopeptidase
MLQFSAARMTPNVNRSAMVVFATKGARLTSEATLIDNAHGKVISKALRNTHFEGEAGQVEVIKGTKVFVVVGLGRAGVADIETWHRAGVKISEGLSATNASEAGVCIGSIASKVGFDEAAIAVAEGMRLGIYRENDYRTKVKPTQEQHLKDVTLFVDGKAQQAVKAAIPGIDGLMNGSDLARKMVDMPPNMAVPSRMAEEAKKLADLGVEVKVLGRKELEKLGMNLMLAVGRAAAEEPQFVMMKYTGAGKKDPYKAIIGKGVMFDTGGYDLKPSKSMYDMKCDMGGAAAVLGTMRALAERKPNINVIGVMGCVMNMIGGDGFLPSDIITGYDGTTVEIGNTDAEGRLVLADCISYTIDTEKPSEIIDLATLTGAIMVALGASYAGLFSNTDSMANKLIKSGQSTSEKVWRMPLGPAYVKKATLADLNNDGIFGGGSSAAAMFLQHFAKKTPWAHLDIAGTAFPSKGEGLAGGLVSSGASGFGVRLLVDYLEGSASADEAPRRGRRRK